MTSPKYSAHGSWLRKPVNQRRRMFRVTPSLYAPVEPNPDDFYLTVLDHAGTLLSLTQSLKMAERVGSAAQGNVIYFGPSSALPKTRTE